MAAYLRKLLYAWYLKDVNILLSDELTPESQILYRRQVRERVATVAPFLVIDQDPYIVVADGQLYWIVDAYTFTRTATRIPSHWPALSTTSATVSRPP